MEMARACDVTNQCQSYVWNVRDENDKVNVTLYYETLCPFCRQFISAQVSPAYQTILDIINITLVPYGNAHETYQPETQLYQYVCQHGADECLGNLIHGFINCTESSTGDMKSVAIQCAEKTKINYTTIDACTKSKLGNQLQHAYAVQTENLQPPHKYVPWITINDQHTEDMQEQAQKDLIKFVCQTYK
ncbi:unnamed protein product, partial [Didymodactylos carnosus]